MAKPQSKVNVAVSFLLRLGLSGSFLDRSANFSLGVTTFSESGRKVYDILINVPPVAQGTKVPEDQIH